MDLKERVCGHEDGLQAGDGHGRGVLSVHVHANRDGSRGRKLLNLLHHLLRVVLLVRVRSGLEPAGG